MRSSFIGSLLLAIGLILTSTSASAQIRGFVTMAPPMLPIYDQPLCPGDGYLWTPGYWAWDNEYYWVSGEWVMPPEAGFLWTPGYWGWGGEGFMFNEGYWGQSVGFYGGINYSFGYFGSGYYGGRWDHGHFFYNSTLNNINRNSIHNIYETRVNEPAGTNHTSYNGGRGGIEARANSQEEAASHDRHIAPVARQNDHAQTARNDPQQRFAANHGVPAGAGGNRSNAAVHPKELPAIDRLAKPDTGNAKLDQKYQKQQDKLVARQNQDRQKLQGQQDREHQQVAKQQANEQRTQQQEQRHQQQTQQMQQRHTQQSQNMTQRQSMGGGARGGGGGGSRGGGGGGRR